MNRLVTTVLAATLLGAPRVALPDGTITARAKLGAAIAEAKKWKADAALASVATSNANKDGTSAYWTYNFQSKSTKSCFRVVALADGRTIPSSLGECTLAQGIAEDFVDSPAALSAASAGGFKAGETINFGLGHHYDQNLTPSRACWTVFSPENDFDSSKSVMRGWCVDPKSGKFIVRTAGQGGHGK